MSNSRNRGARRARAAVSQLVEMFPAAFARFDRKPLKLGIRKDLLARGISIRTIASGLGSYCHSIDYLGAMKTGAARIDLDGNAAGVVTADEAEDAARKLTEAIARAKAAARKAWAKAKMAKKAKKAEKVAESRAA